MFMTQSQLIGSLRNRAKDAQHKRRMETDPAYREEIERTSREYDEFIAQYGEPEWHSYGANSASDKPVTQTYRNT